MGQIEKVMSHNYANNSDHLSSNIIKRLYIFDLIHFTKKGDRNRVGKTNFT